MGLSMHGFKSHALKLSNSNILTVSNFKAENAKDIDGTIRKSKPIFLEKYGLVSSVVDDVFTNNIIYPQRHFAVEVKNAYLIGERAILTEEEEIFTDSDHWNHSADIFESKVRRDFEKCHFEYDKENNSYVINNDVEIRYHKGTTVLLNSMEQGNYGAYLLRVISKTPLFREMGFENYKFMAEANTNWQKSILAAYGYNLENLIPYDHKCIHKFENLIVLDMATSELFSDDDFYNLNTDLVNHIKKKHGSPSENHKIYISRRGQTLLRPNYRPYIQEDYLIELLKNKGFLIFEPERFPFHEQVRVISSASMIIGPGGAGMFNAIFARNSKNIISLEPMDTWLALHDSLFSGSRLNKGFFVGGIDYADISEQKRWNIPPKLVIEKITQANLI